MSATSSLIDPHNAFSGRNHTSEFPQHPTFGAFASLACSSFTPPSGAASAQCVQTLDARTHAPILEKVMGWAGAPLLGLMGCVDSLTPEITPGSCSRYAESCTQRF